MTPFLAFLRFPLSEKAFDDVYQLSPQPAGYQPSLPTSMMFRHVLIFSHVYLSHNSCREMIIAFPPQVMTALTAK